MFKHRDHTHETVAQARVCETGAVTTTDPIGRDLMDLSGECQGGKCTTIDQLCTRHQMQYQARWGRASNE